MKILFNNKWKRISGVIFYSFIFILFFQSSIKDLFPENLFKLPVFSLFESDIMMASEDSKNNPLSFWEIHLIENDIFDEIIYCIIIISGLLHGFSKEKKEDELINKIRLESLSLSIFINYCLILFFTLTVFDEAYLYVIFYHLFSIIFIFNLINSFRLYRYYHEK